MGDLAGSGSASAYVGEPERRRFTTSVHPVRVRTPHPSLGVDVLRVVGYRWRCTCGERGRREDEHALARASGRRHVFDTHVG